MLRGAVPELHGESNSQHLASCTETTHSQRIDTRKYLSAHITLQFVTVQLPEPLRQFASPGFRLNAVGNTLLKIELF